MDILKLIGKTLPQIAVLVGTYMYWPYEESTYFAMLGFVYLVEISMNLNIIADKKRGE